MLKHTFLWIFLVIFLILFFIGFVYIPAQELGMNKAKYSTFNNCINKATDLSQQEFCARIYK